eukprot:4860586-Prymnesium_polylepis.1
MMNCACTSDQFARKNTLVLRDLATAVGIDGLEKLFKRGRRCSPQVRNLDRGQVLLRHAAHPSETSLASPRAASRQLVTSFSSQ